MLQMCFFCHPTERVRVQLHLRVLAVARLGEAHRLDGLERHQLAAGLHGSGRNLEESLRQGNVFLLQKSPFNSNRMVQHSLGQLVGLNLLFCLRNETT